jgi:hypothetical protein
MSKLYSALYRSRESDAAGELVLVVANGTSEADRMFANDLLQLVETAQRDEWGAVEFVEGDTCTFPDVAPNLFK